VRFLPALRRLKDYDRFWSKFVDYLAASPAGRAGNSLIIDDSNGADFQLRARFGNAREDSGALGTIGHAVRRVFDIAADKSFAFRGKNGRAHAKLGKRRVSIRHRAACRQEQAAAFFVKICFISHCEVVAVHSIPRRIVRECGKISACQPRWLTVQHIDWRGGPLLVQGCHLRETLQNCQ